MVFGQSNNSVQPCLLSFVNLQVISWPCIILRNRPIYFVEHHRATLVITLIAFTFDRGIPKYTCYLVDLWGRAPRRAEGQSSTTSRPLFRKPLSHRTALRRSTARATTTAPRHCWVLYSSGLSLRHPPTLTTSNTLMKTAPPHSSPRMDEATTRSTHRTAAAPIASR